MNNETEIRIRERDLTPDAVVLTRRVKADKRKVVLPKSTSIVNNRAGRRAAGARSEKKAKFAYNAIELSTAPCFDEVETRRIRNAAKRRRRLLAA